MSPNTFESVLLDTLFEPARIELEQNKFCKVQLEIARRNKQEFFIGKFVCVPSKLDATSDSSNMLVEAVLECRLIEAPHDEALRTDSCKLTLTAKGSPLAGFAESDCSISLSRYHSPDKPFGTLLSRLQTELGYAWMSLAESQNNIVYKGHALSAGDMS